MTVNELHEIRDVMMDRNLLGDTVGIDVLNLPDWELLNLINTSISEAVSDLSWKEQYEGLNDKEEEDWKVIDEILDKIMDVSIPITS